MERAIDRELGLVDTLGCGRVGVCDGVYHAAIGAHISGSGGGLARLFANGEFGLRFFPENVFDLASDRGRRVLTV